MTYLTQLTKNREVLANQITNSGDPDTLGWILDETDKEIRSALGECCVSCGEDPHHDGGHPVTLIDARTGDVTATWCEYCYAEANEFLPFMQ